MGDGESLVSELAGNENRYLLVRPSSALYGGYEVVNVWNGDVKRRGMDKDDAVQYARERAQTSSSFDFVLEVHEPMPIEEDDE